MCTLITYLFISYSSQVESSVCPSIHPSIRHLYVCLSFTDLILLNIMHYILKHYIHYKQASRQPSDVLQQLIPLPSILQRCHYSPPSLTFPHLVNTSHTFLSIVDVIPYLLPSTFCFLRTSDYDAVTAQLFPTSDLLSSFSSSIYQHPSLLTIL